MAVRSQHCARQREGRAAGTRGSATGRCTVSLVTARPSHGELQILSNELRTRQCLRAQQHRGGRRLRKARAGACLPLGCVEGLGGRIHLGGGRVQRIGGAVRYRGGGHVERAPWAGKVAAARAARALNAGKSAGGQTKGCPGVARQRGAVREGCGRVGRVDCEYHSAKGSTL